MNPISNAQPIPTTRRRFLKSSVAAMATITLAGTKSSG